MAAVRPPAVAVVTPGATTIMLTIGDTVRVGRRLARRPFLRIGAAGSAGGLVAGLADLAGHGGRAVAASSGLAPFLRDRSVIFLFMHGGPSQFETFDPHDDGPPHARSTTGAIPTSLPGVRFGGTFPQLAARAHLLTIVRSFVTGDGQHDIKPVVGKATGGASLGSLYARVAGPLRPDTAMPTNVLLLPRAVRDDAGPPITQFGDFAATGDLGPAAAAIVPGGDGGGLLDDLRLHLPQDRLADRRSLLAGLDRGRRWLDLASVRGVADEQRRAFDLLVSGVSDAFDLEREDPVLVDRYDTASRFRTDAIDTRWNNHRHYADHGRSIGRLLLLARRLCERGAGFVTVTTSFVWDMHADVNNATMVEGMGYVGAPFDHAVAALIDDIEARGLRDRILLVCCGEMGRTPVINARGGRDHWGGLAPLVLYGGGLPAGRVIGRSTRDGGQPASDPVRIPDLVATIAEAVFDLAEVRLLEGLPRSLQATLAAGRPLGRPG